MSSVNAVPPLGATLALEKRVFAFGSDVFARKTFGKCFRLCKQRLRSVDAFSTLRGTFVLCLRGTFSIG